MSSKLLFVVDQLRTRIGEGHWKVGEKLPVEAQLAQEFGCSIGTVNKAFALLAHDGLIERRTRAGTTVLSPAPRVDPSKQLDAFAFIYPSEQHEGIWQTVIGFQEAAKAAKRRVLTFSSGIDYEKEADYISRLSEFDVKAAAFYPVFLSADEQVHFTQMIKASKFQIISVEISLPGSGISSVAVNGIHAGYTMTKHLIDLGLKKIGFLSNYSWVPFMRDRFQGYKWALEESGIALQPEWVKLENVMNPDFEDPLEEPTYIASQYLENVKGIEGVVCGNDFLAHGMIFAAQKKGIKIPKHLKVVGIDDFQAPEKLPVALTTYHVPYRQMGVEAFNLLNAIVDKKINAETEKQVRGEIVIRESSKS